MPLVCHTSCFLASSRVNTSLLRYAPGSGLRTKPSPPSTTAPPSLPPKPVYTPMHNSGLVCAPAFDYSDRSASARIACAEHLTVQSKIRPAPYMHIVRFIYAHFLRMAYAQKGEICALSMLILLRYAHTCAQFSPSICSDYACFLPSFVLDLCTWAWSEFYIQECHPNLGFRCSNRESEIKFNHNLNS